MTTVERLLKTARKQDPAKAGGPRLYSKNQEWLAEHISGDHHRQKLLTGSSLYKWASTNAWAKKKLLECEDRGVHGNATDMAWRCSEDFTPWPYNPDTDSDRSQLMAKLHILYGVPIQAIHPRADQVQKSLRYNLRSDTIPTHPYARSRTYDMRQHNQTTLWGPFQDTSPLKVDWEKLEAVMLILDHNLKHFSSQIDLNVPGEVWPSSRVPNWTVPFMGASPGSYVPQTPLSALETSITSSSHHSASDNASSALPNEPAIPLDASDPYGVTGTWARIVCFLDYNELYDFNFSNRPPNTGFPRPPLDTGEAIRLITMRIRVTSIEDANADSDSSDGSQYTPASSSFPNTSKSKSRSKYKQNKSDPTPTHPVVWFKGHSTSIRPSWDPNANSKIRGCVRLTPEGEVHWTTWSIFHGEERWKSEGVQVGGVRSGRGVLGFWCDKDLDMHGPAGPTAFWKVGDAVEDGGEGGEEERRRERMREVGGLHVPLY